MSFSPLMTDRYEFTMLQAALADGTAEKRATFEVYTRGLTKGFRFGVFSGLGRLLPMIEAFQFSPHEVSWMLSNGVINEQTANYLTSFRFSGRISGYREGELFFPNSPVLTVEGTFAECVLLETLVLSVLNHDSAIASKAARMVMAAEGRTLIEMGSRRTNEESAVAAARAAYIAGFDTTSNMLAGMKYGVPTAGTAAHAWTLAHEDEEEGFKAQIASMGPGTTLLVDTYNIREGIKKAMHAWNEYAWPSESAVTPLGGVRIDSGDLSAESEKARVLLDENGFKDTRIVVSGDMDEHTMKDLKDAPINAYGVGTKLVSTPPMGFVYKLVEIEDNGKMRPVHKKSKGKVSVGGLKQAYRILDRRGVSSEVYTVRGESLKGIEAGAAVQTLTDTMMDAGVRTYAGAAPMSEARDLCKARMSQLPKSEQKVWSGEYGPFLTAEKSA